MELLTIGDVIAYTDGIKPNMQTPEEKKQWLNDLDTMIKEDIIDTHEDFENVEHAIFLGPCGATPQLLPDGLKKVLIKLLIVFHFLSRLYDV